MADLEATRFIWKLLAPVAGAVVVVACSGSSSAPEPSGGCESNADCGAGQSCVFGACEGAPAPVDAGPKPTPDAAPACTTIECGGTCCAAGDTCENGACTAPATCSTVQCGSTCCPAGDTCQNGACTPPCATPGQSCTETSMCCQSGTGVGSAGAVCISNDGECHAICTANSQCESGCCAGVQGESYGVCAAASDCQTLGGVGDACSSGTTCASGDCTGKWCTSACSASNAVCAGGHGTDGLYNEYGQFNWCVENGGGTDTCFPGCTTNADCAHYAGTTCKAVTDVTGTSTSVCAS